MRKDIEEITTTLKGIRKAIKDKADSIRDKQKQSAS